MSESQTLFEGADDQDPITFAREILLDGSTRALAWTEARCWRPQTDGDLLWVHLDRSTPEVSAWLRDELRISDTTVQAVTSARNRPRAFRDGDGMVTILRGLDTDEGADPAQMVSIQIWVDAAHVVTLSTRKTAATAEVRSRLDASRLAHVTAGDLLTRLVEKVVSDIGPVVLGLNEQIDALDGSDDVDGVLTAISEIRRKCLALKRHMSPQVDALLDIRRQTPPWLSDANRDAIRETIDQLHHYVENIAVVQESVLVLQDDLNSRAAAQTTKTTYLLSIVAAIFLPISFLSGVLGMNVGGTPGVGAHNGFWLVCGLMAVLVTVQLTVFRRLRWI